MDWVLMAMVFGALFVIASCRIEYADCKYSEERVENNDSSLFYLKRGGYYGSTRITR